MEPTRAEIRKLQGHIFDQQINHARQMTELRIENDRLTRKLALFKEALVKAGIDPNQILFDPNARQLPPVSSRVPLPQIQPVAAADQVLAEETLARMRKRRRVDTSEIINLTC